MASSWPGVGSWSPMNFQHFWMRSLGDDPYYARIYQPVFEALFLTCSERCWGWKPMSSSCGKLAYWQQSAVNLTDTLLWLQSYVWRKVLSGSMRLQDPSAADFDVALVSSAEITTKIYKVLLSNEHKHKRRHSFLWNKLQEREDKTQVLLMNFEPCMLFLNKTWVWRLRSMHSILLSWGFTRNLTHLSCKSWRNWLQKLQAAAVLHVWLRACGEWPGDNCSTLVWRAAIEMGLPQDNSFLLKINICFTLAGMQVFQHEGMILVLHFTCFNNEWNGMLIWNLGLLQDHPNRNTDSDLHRFYGPGIVWGSGQTSVIGWSCKAEQQRLLPHMMLGSR